jgi:hypothetical protein
MHIAGIFGIVALALTSIGVCGISLQPSIVRNLYWARGEVFIPDEQLSRVYYIGLRMVVVSTTSIINASREELAFPARGQAHQTSIEEEVTVERAFLWRNQTVCRELHNSSKRDGAYDFCMECEQSSIKLVTCVLFALVGV